MKKIIYVVLQGLGVWGLLQLGNVLSRLIQPFIYIPGSIVGMILLLTMLVSGLIKESYIALLSDFMLKHMGFFFIPLGVGLMTSVDMLRTSWLPLLAVLIISGALVMLVSAKVTEGLMKLTKKGEVTR